MTTQQELKKAYDTTRIAYIKAEKACDDTYKAQFEAIDAYRNACKVYEVALKAYEVALKAYREALNKRLRA